MRIVQVMKNLNFQWRRWTKLWLKHSTGVCMKVCRTQSCPWSQPPLPKSTFLSTTTTMGLSSIWSNRPSKRLANSWTFRLNQMWLTILSLREGTTSLSLGLTVRLSWVLSPSLNLRESRDSSKKLRATCSATIQKWIFKKCLRSRKAWTRWLLKSRGSKGNHSMK